MHATGVGKVLLAHAPADAHDRVLARLTRITPYTIIRPDVLEAQLDRVRRDAVAAAIRVVVGTLKRDRQRARSQISAPQVMSLLCRRKL